MKNKILYFRGNDEANKARLTGWFAYLWWSKGRNVTTVRSRVPNLLPQGSLLIGSAGAMSWRCAEQGYLVLVETREDKDTKCVPVWKNSPQQFERYVRQLIFAGFDSMSPLNIQEQVLALDWGLPRSRFVSSLPARLEYRERLNELLTKFKHLIFGGLENEVLVNLYGELQFLV